MPIAVTGVSVERPECRGVDVVEEAGLFEARWQERIVEEEYEFGVHRTQ